MRGVCPTGVDFLRLIMAQETLLRLWFEGGEERKRIRDRGVDEDQAGKSYTQSVFSSRHVLVFGTRPQQGVVAHLARPTDRVLEQGHGRGLARSREKYIEHPLVRVCGGHGKPRVATPLVLLLLLLLPVATTTTGRTEKGSGVEAVSEPADVSSCCGRDGKQQQKNSYQRQRKELAGAHAKGLVAGLDERCVCIWWMGGFDED